MNTDNFPPQREGRKIAFSAVIDGELMVDVYPQDGEKEEIEEIGKTLQSSLKGRINNLCIDNVVICETIKE